MRVHVPVCVGSVSGLWGVQLNGPNAMALVNIAADTLQIAGKALQGVVLVVLSAGQHRV